MVKKKAKKRVKKKVKRKAKKKVKKKVKKKAKKKAPAKISAGKFVVTKKALALLLAAHVDVDRAAKRMMAAKKELARTTFR
jgi:hypothetical protein